MPQKLPSSHVPKRSTDHVWLASFDIGKRNFAFYIEQVHPSTLDALETLTRSKRYEKNGECTFHQQSVINHVCGYGTSILYKNIDLTLTTSSTSAVYLDPEVFHAMTECLDMYMAYWNQCSVFVIEKQMAFGMTRNTMAVKLGQHCYSYFAIRYGRFKDILEFPAYYKTKILGAPKKLMSNGTYRAVDKPSRKKWTVGEARRILSARKDTEMLLHLNSAKKRDDLADVLCQLQAFKYLAFVSKELT